MWIYILIGVISFLAGAIFGAWAMRWMILEGNRILAAIEAVAKTATPF